MFQRSLFCEYSPYFQKAFKGEFRESKEKAIYLPNFTVSIVRLQQFQQYGQSIRPKLQETSKESKPVARKLRLDRNDDDPTPTWIDRRGEPYRRRQLLRQLKRYIIPVQEPNEIPSDASALVRLCWCLRYNSTATGRYECSCNARSVQQRQQRQQGHHGFLDANLAHRGVIQRNASRIAYMPIRCQEHAAKSYHLVH